MPNFEDLPHLLRLLDDDQPDVQSAVRKGLLGFGGDLSSHLANLAIQLDSKQRKQLTVLLRPKRREILRAEWQVPRSGLFGTHQDWETFESMLRQISDYLHDGITLRAPLSDGLDLLATEFEEEFGAPSADDVRQALFVSERFKGNSADYYGPQNSDLAWVLENEQGNPLALSTVFILLGHRLGLEVGACNYPGHFLARAEIDGDPCLIDCFNKGRLINIPELLAGTNISGEARAAVRFEAPPGILLKRTLVNLAHSFARRDEEEDELLALELASSLEGLAVAE